VPFQFIGTSIFQVEPSLVWPVLHVTAAFVHVGICVSAREAVVAAVAVATAAKQEISKSFRTCVSLPIRNF
jgi:hypothetical protein